MRTYDGEHKIQHVPHQHLARACEIGMDSTHMRKVKSQSVKPGRGPSFMGAYAQVGTCVIACALAL